MFFYAYAVVSMAGQLTYLGSRSAEEAWPFVKGLFVEENFVVRRVAKRLRVHYATVHRWLEKNPKLAKELDELRKKAIEERMNG